MSGPNDYPPGFRFGIIPVVDWVVRLSRGTLYALFGAVSLLPVIACCNVANMLLLARATHPRARKSRFARQSAPAAAASSGSCSSRVRCSRAAGSSSDA